MALRELSPQELENRFRAVVELSAAEQGKVFLKGFVLEFQGHIEEILDLAVQFSKFGCGDGPGLLGEFETHLFLEKREETLTVTGLRENMKEIHLDKHRKVAFLEYVLWKYGKSLQELFAPPAVSPEALEALEKAISQYEKTLATRRAREERMDELERAAAQGGVKGKAAKNQLDQMKAEDLLQQNKNEITSAAAKRKAQRVVDDVEAAERERERQRQAAMKQEEERMAEEKRRKDAEEAQVREQSKSRLKARAAMWNQ